MLSRWRAKARPRDLLDQTAERQGRHTRSEFTLDNPLLATGKLRRLLKTKAPGEK